MVKCILFQIIPWLVCYCAHAPAGTLFQWRDDKGQLHLSDTRPVGHQATERELKVTAPYLEKTGRLRPGELETLKASQQRASRKYRQLQGERQRNDRQVNRKRKDCRDYRDKLRATRNREARKNYILQLRRKCW